MHFLVVVQFDPVKRNASERAEKICHLTLSLPLLPRRMTRVSKHAEENTRADPDAGGNQEQGYDEGNPEHAFDSPVSRPALKEGVLHGVLAILLGRLMRWRFDIRWWRGLLI